MIFRKSSSAIRVFALSGFLVALAGCNDTVEVGNLPEPPPPPPPPVTYSYEVTVTNLTQAQPLSPIAVMLHGEESFFTLGEPASEAIEIMAEGGDPSELLGLDIVLESTNGTGPVTPGETQTFTVSIEDNDSANLAVLTMLASTNDAFSGFQGLSLAGMEVGDVQYRLTNVYDSGTEANTEEAATLVTMMGEGFNAERDDVDFVAMHPGVVGNQDGLPNSALTGAHRFDNPAIKITVTRTE
ncbi:spondin domain-containing protein [Alteromonas sp. a30]|uniref:spondin domain-containing protein n=1 Tax=Alteromonas sp. a30 TaxID=2730917 RepID=UPI00227DF936|nr:spondin domain-containing protein [Alteromonas sp. a30]MCY7296931.1 hypothetical protein [Alteromonas sp. a30]